LIRQNIFHHLPCIPPIEIPTIASAALFGVIVRFEERLHGRSASPLQCLSNQPEKLLRVVTSWCSRTAGMSSTEIRQKLVDYVHFTSLPPLLAGSLN